eukprot:843265_1
MALYEDGLRLDDSDRRETYYDFVMKVYEAAGDNRFFDEFIEKHFKREIIIWNHKMEGEKVLTSKTQIFEVLKGVDFSKFDFSKDDNINWIEFQNYFRKHGFFVDKTILREIFDTIDETNDKDRKITKAEFQQWKQDVNTELEFETPEMTHEFGSYVYYDSERNCYEFMDECKDPSSTFIPLRNDRKGIQWALFVPKLSRKQKSKIEARGYWHILNDEDDEKDLRKRIPVPSIR